MFADSTAIYVADSRIHRPIFGNVPHDHFEETHTTENVDKSNRKKNINTMLLRPMNPIVTVNVNVISILIVNVILMRRQHKFDFVLGSCFLNE
jgi:hypothetical protein